MAAIKTVEHVIFIITISSRLPRRSGRGTEEVAAEKMREPGTSTLCYNNYRIISFFGHLCPPNDYQRRAKNRNYIISYARNDSAGKNITVLILTHTHAQCTGLRTYRGLC